MYQCDFELNDKPMSAFKIGARSFDAFSGLSPYVTIDRQSDFNQIRAMLKGSSKQAIPGSTLSAYGKVVVT